MESEASRNWNKVLGISVAVVIVIGVAFVIGAFAVGPSRAKAGGGYLPSAVLTMPVGNLPARTADGNALTLLVRIAETPEARKAGLASVGTKALDATVLLYVQPKITTARITYVMSGICAPLELAVIGELGDIVAIKKVEANAKSIAITERHRYVLAAKEGVLGKLGIVKGVSVSPVDMKRIS